MESSSVSYSNPRNYSWAAFLILVGIMLLLNTTGVIDWSIWIYVMRFWPILIVLIGVRIILGNSLFARIIGMLLTIVLTSGAFLVAYVQAKGEAVSFLPDKVNDWVLEGGSGVFNLAGEKVEESIVLDFDEYSDIEERTLEMEVGACEFILSEEDIDEYIKIDSKFPKGYDSPELNHSSDSGELSLEFDGASSKGVNLFYDESEYDIKLGQLDIPTNLDIKLGAGKGEVSFESLKLNDLWAEVGAGKLDIDLDMDSMPTGEVRLTVGAGQMSMNIPQRVGYVINYDLGVGHIEADGNDISGVSGGRGKFTSSNYESSDIKLDIFVSVGVGEFSIESI